MSVVTDMQIQSFYTKQLFMHSLWCFKTVELCNESNLLKKYRIMCKDYQTWML